MFSDLFYYHESKRRIVTFQSISDKDRFDNRIQNDTAEVKPHSRTMKKEVSPEKVIPMDSDDFESF